MVPQRQAAYAVAIPLVWLATIALTRVADPLWTVLCASALLVLATGRIRPAVRPALRPGSAIALGVAAAAAMLLVTYLVAPIALRLVPDAKSLLAIMTGGRRPAVALLFVIPIVFAEELIWRWRYEALMPRPRALCCAAVYALAHASRGSLLLVVVAFVCGLYWSLLREHSGSIVPPLLAHLAWDIAIIAFPLI